MAKAAVLPIDFPRATRDDVLLAGGMHADICGELNRFHSLRVISPASAAAVSF